MRTDPLHCLQQLLCASWEGLALPQSLCCPLMVTVLSAVKVVGDRFLWELWSRRISVQRLGTAGGFIYGVCHWRWEERERNLSNSLRGILFLDWKLKISLVLSAVLSLPGPRNTRGRGVLVPGCLFIFLSEHPCLEAECKICLKLRGDTIWLSQLDWIPPPKPHPSVCH